MDFSMGIHVTKLVDAVQREDRTSVCLENGVSYSSPCFAGAQTGETWAVLIQPAPPFAFGQIEHAVRVKTVDGTLCVFDSDLNLNPAAVRFVQALNDAYRSKEAPCSSTVA